MQNRLIEAVISGDDVLLRDDTGTGKCVFDLDATSGQG
jgi:hypothetical protein